ncbi:MAG TPA: glutaredoxin domain-containing protein [Polyangiales bacterium]|nr:glutaredoxin domain-containing protein [Polyangiales bacterium]
MSTFFRMFLVAAVLGAGCGKSMDSSAAAASAEPGESASPGQPAPEPVKPPFAVAGECDDLLLVWYDATGLHTATKRSEIPEASRASVRVDSLRVAPDQRLDPDHVYVADLRNAAADGQYAVQKATRDWFDSQVDRLKPPPPVAKADDVVIYKASWCGACKAAAAYMKQRHVMFTEKDVEKDPGAAAEMQRKASAKGLTPRGVPVIDFRGELMLGFDQQRLGQLIDRLGKAI